MSCVVSCFCLVLVRFFWMLNCVLFRFSWLVGLRVFFMVFRLCLWFSRWLFVYSWRRCVGFCWWLVGFWGCCFYWVIFIWGS